MFKNDERYWDINLLNKWFAISSIIFLACTVWVFVDDNDDDNDADEDVLTPVFKQIRGLLKKPVRSPLAKAWVTQEMKRRGITRRPKGF